MEWVDHMYVGKETGSQSNSYGHVAIGIININSTPIIMLASMWDWGSDTLHCSIYTHTTNTAIN